LYSTVSTLKPGGKHRGRAREARRWCCACGWPRKKISCARTNGGNGGHDFAQLQLVQDGRLAGRVKPHLEGGQEPVARQSPVFRAASKFDTPRPEGRPGARPAVATPGISAALREEAARGCGVLQRRKLSELPCPQRPTLAAPRAARARARAMRMRISRLLNSRENSCAARLRAQRRFQGPTGTSSTRALVKVSPMAAGRASEPTSGNGSA
jgi:hypothetical protein